MARKAPNMKVNVTADNRDLTQKMKESKAAVKDFDKVSSAALGKLGEAFGVNVDKIEQMASALKGLGVKMQDTGNAGTQAFGKVLTSVNGVAAGLAGIGIAAVVSGFKLLKEEAEAFKNTLEGANIDAQTTAFISTYSQALHDATREVGENSAEVFADLERKWETFWANAKFVAVSAIAEIGKQGFSGAGDRAVSTFVNALQGNFINAFSNITLGVGKAGANAFAGFQQVQGSAAAVGEEAARLQGRMYDIQVKLVNKAVEWARMERQIAEYKRIAYDKTVDTATQQDALNKATDLIKTRYKEEASLKKQLADLQEQYNNLASSSLQDIEKANQLRIDEENTIAGMNNALRELSERQASVAQQAQKEAEAQAEALANAKALAEEQAAIAKSRADLQDWRIEAKVEIPEIEAKVLLPEIPDIPELEVKVDTEDLQYAVTPAVDTTADIYSLLPQGAQALVENGLAIPIKPELDTSEIIDLTTELQSIISSSMETIGTAIGQLVGDLTTGGDAWGNFADIAISAFADMAISVGKIAISTGIATSGIKAALESLNPYLAIAAGVALVALGTAVKTSMSNVASGGSYSSSAGVAYSGSSGSSSYGSDVEDRELMVRVTGTIRADGNQLLTVIENENNRKNHTT